MSQKPDNRIGEPFAGFDNFDACVTTMINQGKDPDSARQICGKLQSQFETILKENTVQIQELDGAESAFEWVPNIDKLKEMSKNGPAKLYKVVAIHPVVTDRKDEGHGPRKYGDRELSMAARTLAEKMLNINHRIKITEGRNFVADAEYNTKLDRLEALVFIEDRQIQKAIEEKKITKVSVQGHGRTIKEACLDKQCTRKAVEPSGIMYNGLALVATEPFQYNGQTIEAARPGDIRSTIEILETIDSGTNSDSNTSLESDSSPNKSMSENNNTQTQLKENLDDAIAKINAMDVPPEFKEELVKKARELYAGQNGMGNGETQTNTNTNTNSESTTNNQTQTTGETQTSDPKPDPKIAELEKQVKEISDKLNSKLEETFNKVIDEKLQPLTKKLEEQNKKPDDTPDNKVKSLESLSEDQLDTAIAEKLKTTSLAECIEVKQ